MNATVHPPASSEPQTATFTSAEFRAIVASGALDRYAKSELIDGQIIVANAQHTPHMELELLIYDALHSVIGRGGELDVGCEGTVELADGKMPMPDVFIWRRGDIVDAVPGDRLRLVIEVSDTTDSYDLGRKKRLYASAGVPEYWVAVMAKKRIERFAEPCGDQYARHDRFPFAEGCASATLPGLAIPAGWLT